MSTVEYFRRGKGNDIKYYSAATGAVISKDKSGTKYVAVPVPPQFRAKAKKGEGKKPMVTSAHKAERKMVKAAGIRGLAAYHQQSKEVETKGEGFADPKSMKMFYKLTALHPKEVDRFDELSREKGAHYFKYNQHTHAFDLYNYKTLHLATFHLPDDIRSRKVVKSAK